MKRKLLKLALALVLVTAVTIAAVPLHAITYLHFSGTDKTDRDLKEFLSNLEWNRDYERGVFDCSDMSEKLCDALRGEGFKCIIVTDIGHSWVQVKTVQGVQNVEAVGLYMDAQEETPRYAVHPALAGLLNVAEIFTVGAGEGELVPKPSPTPTPTPIKESNGNTSAQITLQ